MCMCNTAVYVCVCVCLCVCVCMRVCVFMCICMYLYIIINVFSLPPTYYTNDECGHAILTHFPIINSPSHSFSICLQDLAHLLCLGEHMSY